MMEKIHIPVWILITACALIQTGCRRPSSPETSPPGAELNSEFPDWVKAYGLVFPDSVSYRLKNTFIQKSILGKEAIRSHYEAIFSSLKFRKVTELNQGNAYLAQYEKNQELISLEIEKLVYSSNHLIRLGHNRVAYSRKVTGEKIEH